MADAPWVTQEASREGVLVAKPIKGYLVARSLETTGAEHMETVFPHPTLSEMMHEAVLDALARDPLLKETR